MPFPKALLEKVIPGLVRNFGVSIGASIGVLLCLSGCKPGFESIENDNDSDNPATSHSFISSGDSSTWLLDIVDNDSFDLALKTRPNGTLRVSVGGSYEDLSSGFSRLQVISATGTDAPALETRLPALRLDDQLLLLHPWDNNGLLLPFIPDNGCPESPFTANWIQLTTPSGDLANNTSTPFFGVMSYSPDDEEIAIAHRYALTEDFPDLGAAESLPTGPCEEGFSLRDESHFFFADNGSALVHLSIGSSDESLWLALPDAVISAADLDGTYIGFWVDNSRIASDRLWSVTTTCTAGSCPVERITDVADLNSHANQRFQINLDEETLDEPQQGLVMGSTEVTLSAFDTRTGRLICMASDDFNNTGDKLLACVGQSPTNPELTVHGFLVAKD
jgi:hypothetical protein